MYLKSELISERYEVREALYGGMGVVYCCIDQTDGQPVALKTLQDRLIPSIAGMERFVREASTWVSLGRHPHIVYARKVENLDGQPYIFMEYVPARPQFGSSLRGWILSRDLTVEMALRVAIQLSDGLAYAQQRQPGLVHRDLKPENVLITPDRVAKVTDFGLASAVTEELLAAMPEEEKPEPFCATLTRSGRVMGTPPYMSPEQCRGEEVDLRSDIYSLGCVLYEMLTGEWIFKAATVAEWLTCHQTDEPRAPSAVRSEVGGLVDAIVLRCLRKRRGERYATFEELGVALRAAYEEMEGWAYQVPDMGHEEEDEVTVRLNRTNSYAALADYQRMLEESDRLIEVAPPNRAEAWNLRGTALNGLNRFTEAIECYEHGLGLNPNDNRIKVNIGVALLAQGNTEQASAIFHEVIESETGDFGNRSTLGVSWNGLGIANMQREDLDAALECFDRVLKLTPWLWQAWKNRGAVLAGLGRAAEASQSNMMAFRYCHAYEDRANLALYLMGSQESAISRDETFFDAALKAVHRVPVLSRRFDASTLKLLYGLPADFDATHELSFIHFMRTLEVQCARANAQIKDGRIRDALLVADVLENSIKAFFESVPLHSVLARRRVASGCFLFCGASFAADDRHEFAIRFLEQALLFQPDSCICWVLCGYAYFQLRKWKGAHKYLSLALSSWDESMDGIVEFTRSHIQDLDTFARNQT